MANAPPGEIQRRFRPPIDRDDRGASLEASDGGVASAPDSHEEQFTWLALQRRSIPEQSKPAPSTSPHTHVNQPGSLAASSGGGGSGGAPCVGETIYAIPF